MRFAARINSFKKTYPDVREIIRVMSSVEGLTDIEMNLPEHLNGHEYSEMKKLIADSGMNFSGAAVRYRDEMLMGEFSYPRNMLKAVDIAKQSIDTVANLGGTCLTIWLAYDGFDYSFQIDYQTYWNNVINTFRTIADYNPEMNISIEFKPWEPRSYSIMPNTGTALHAVNCIDRENVGITIDYCHSLMAGENPSLSLVLAGMQNKLFGVHLNDGNGRADDGLIYGSASLVKSIEFMYYLKRLQYDGLIYFDTFPIREHPVTEIELNLRTFKAVERKLEEIGMEELTSRLSSNELSGQSFVIDHFL